jgi:CheY-like chemotaxis protein
MDRSQSKQLLLIADANPENVNVLKAMLAPDYDINVAVDAEEAIRLASSSDTPALILLNSMMPAASLRSRPPKTRKQKALNSAPRIT